MKRFVVVGPQRSGTTVVHLALRGHPEVCAVNDEVRIVPLFSEGSAQYMISGTQFMTDAERSAQFSALFDAICSVERGPDTLAWGLKIASDSYDATVTFVDCLQRHLKDVVVIVMVRDDLVAQYGSSLRRAATGQAHSWREVTGSSDFKVSISEWKFSRYARNVVRIYDALKRLDATHKVVLVSYEKDILEGTGEVFELVFRELGVAQLDVTWLNSQKVAPPPDAYISNYAELVAVLKRIRNGGKGRDRDETLFRFENAARRWRQRLLIARNALSPNPK